MTRVEELTEDMVFLVQGCDREFFEKYTTKLNDLISASHAEGVAEERERIRKTAQVWLTGSPPPDDKWYGVDKKELDPLLAPKEKP
jgi:hypothetical protein